MARSTHVEGDVTLDAFIDPAGNVTDVTVISGHALLRQAAVDALRKWKYQPARLNGQLVASHLSVTMKFRFGAGAR